MNEEHAPPSDNRLFPVAGPTPPNVDNDFYTPPWIFERLAVRFDIDVCAPPAGVPWIPADRHYTEVDDGLTAAWDGFVWMNPPFNDSGRWVDRFIAHRNGIALVMHCRSHWHSRLWAHADALTDPTHANPAGTLLKFTRPNGDLCGIFQPVMLAAFGERGVAALQRIGVARIPANAPPYESTKGNVAQRAGRRDRVSSIRAGKAA